MKKRTVQLDLNLMVILAVIALVIHISYSKGFESSENKRKATAKQRSISQADNAKAMWMEKQHDSLARLVVDRAISFIND